MQKHGISSKKSEPTTKYVRDSCLFIHHFGSTERCSSMPILVICKKNVRDKPKSTLIQTHMINCQHTLIKNRKEKEKDTDLFQGSELRR